MNPIPSLQHTGLYLIPPDNSSCACNKMELTIIIVLVELAAAVQGRPSKELLKKASDCIKNIIPNTDWMSGDVFHYEYMVNISYQWDPLNHHDYLKWSRYEGAEAWRAGCHFSDTIHRCLQPVMEEKIDLNHYWKDVQADAKTRSTFYMIINSLFYLTLCKHENVLINNAVCIHNRMLSDDVLRCSGVLGWIKGNALFIINKQLSQTLDTMMVKSDGNVYSAVYECIYTRGQWKRACGKEVDVTMSHIKNEFIQLIRKYTILTVQFADTIFGGNICDRCKEESVLLVFKRFNGIIYSMLNYLLIANQSPDLYKECHLVDYPLNKCHTQNFWRRDLFNMFCHNVTFMVAPQLKPYLPLCDFDEWIRSAERICNMGYDRMMDLAGHIEHCTDGKDELFPCYKGLYIDDYMSWGMITASRLWSGVNVTKLGLTFKTIYPRIKQCSKLVYDHLSNTCRHGPPVVRLIQDLRTVLMFNQHHIAIIGLTWLDYHQDMINIYNQHVGQC